jgi:hypothetical protein
LSEFGENLVEIAFGFAIGDLVLRYSYSDVEIADKEFARVCWGLFDDFFRLE